jgi:hypothetical protein
MRILNWIGTGLPVLLLSVAACGGGENGAVQVTGVTLARDDGQGGPGETVTFFEPTDRRFHAEVKLNRVKTGLTGKLVWLAVDAGGQQDTVIAEADLSSLVANTINGQVELPQDWPLGRYRLEVYLDGELAHSHEFQVQKGSEEGGEPLTSGQESPAQAASSEIGAGDEIELEYWRTVKDSQHAEDLGAYLERYPEGVFADLARARVERLSKEPTEPPPASAAAPPRTAPPATKRSREQVVKVVIRRHTQSYSDPRLHIAPNIPRRKLDNVAELHGLDPSRVLLLYDDGASGGGKTGFCLTDRKVYWRFISGSPAYSLDYEEIRQVRVRANKFAVNGYDIGVTMAQDSPRAAEVFADLLEEIRDQLDRR